MTRRKFIPSLLGAIVAPRIVNSTPKPTRRQSLSVPAEYNNAHLVVLDSEGKVYRCCVSCRGIIEFIPL